MANDSIYLMSGEELVEMRNQPYESEDLLQELLAKHRTFPQPTERASTTTWRDIFVTQERSRQVSSEVRLVKIYVGHRPNKRANRVMALFVMA